MSLLEIDNQSDPKSLLDWDEIYLYNPERRQQYLEILMCQKVRKGEDITLCMTALNYLNSSTVEQKINQIVVQSAKEKSTFASLQRVCITSFAILGMIAFLSGVCNPVRSPSRATPSVVERHQINGSL